MAGGNKVVVSVELLGVDLDLWCLDCNLSTGVRLWYTTTDGPTTTLHDREVCTECQGPNITDA